MEDAEDQSVLLVLHQVREGHTCPVLDVFGQVPVEPRERLLAVEAGPLAVPVLRVVNLHKVAV